MMQKRKTPLLLFQCLFVTLWMFVISSCAFKSQTANIMPRLQSDSEKIGRGIPVKLFVIDERGDKYVGRRAYKGSDIDLSQDIDKTLFDAFNQALKIRDFHVNDASHTNLVVSVEKLKYKERTALFGPKVTISFFLEVACNGNVSEYQTKIQLEHSKQFGVIPTAKKNEEMLNEILGEGVEKTFQNVEMVSCLMGKEK